MTGYIYISESNFYNKKNVRKVGLTMYPVHRLQQYNTGHCDEDGEMYYAGLFEVDSNNYKELRTIEESIHLHFNNERVKRNREFFKVSFKTIHEYIISQKYFIRELSIDEVSDIKKKSETTFTNSELAEYQEELKVMSEETLKQKFFNTFLPYKIPRRVQNELWDKFENICSNNPTELYKGIVQWPMGVGKTISMLSMILLAKELCAKKGEIYRGIFVAPKNDIIDTITKDFSKLSEFGITIYNGSHGNLSKLTIPMNEHLLIMSCPQSLLLDETGMKVLPNISHIHYDEVHRITGELYFQLLKEMLIKWNTKFLTGTSATPKTSSQSQQKKIGELFGDPLNIIHKCDIDEAVKEKWIAKPRFIVKICKNGDKASSIQSFVKAIKDTIQLKKDKGLWTGGKVIAYLPTIDDVFYASHYAKKEMNNSKIYMAIDGERTDKEFVKAVADGSIQILFACERYREGSDIKGIDMTCILMGETISAYILIQIVGRSLRLDSEDKEGWCLVYRPTTDETSENDLLDNITLDIMEFIGESSGVMNKKDITRIVENYLGDLIIDGTVISVKETIDRVQHAYLCKEYAKRTPKEKYTLIREINKEMNILSKNEYFERVEEHSRFIEDPKSYFKDCWNCWYDFLGIDYSLFPQTKADWVRLCKEREFITWEDYKQKRDSILPENPGELYEDFTNWDKEMGVEEEIVW